MFCLVLFKKFLIFFINGGFFKICLEVLVKEFLFVIMLKLLLMIKI